MPSVGPHLMYKLYRLWLPVCVYVCVCSYCGQAQSWQYPWGSMCQPARSAFSCGNDRSFLPCEPWPLCHLPCVIC